jgi:Holliday junction resolvasome RuvABC DNA-binding subunit
MLKMTNRVALSTAIEVLSKSAETFTLTAGEETLTYSAEEVVAKLTAMVEQLDKKASAPKKPTAKQVQAVGEAEEVYEALKALGKAVTVSELMEAVPELRKHSNQKVASLLRSMLDGKVVRTEEKRKAYFQAV